MKMKEILGVIAGLIVVVLLGWVLVVNNFALTKIFSPKYEQVRRETFEQSKAYRQGMIQELQNMQFEYLKANQDQQTALASIILHRVADVPPEALTADLNSFVSGLKNQQGRY